MFKLGDIVTCVNDIGYKGTLTHGRNYEVLNVCRSSRTIRIMGDKNCETISVEHRFVLAGMNSFTTTESNVVSIDCPGNIVVYTTPQLQCEHTFATYTGLLNSFDYCTKCDQKKDVV